MTANPRLDTSPAGTLATRWPGGGRAGTETGIAQAQGLSDRQADESMHAFARLADGLIVDGYAVSAALRYAFFLDCLHSRDYLGYSRRQLRHWLIPTACHYEAPAAAVLFAQEGDSQREREHIEPLANWLCEHGVTAGTLRDSLHTRPRRLTTSLLTAVRWQALLPGVRQHVRVVDDVAHSLMREFDLAAPFVHWWRVHVASAVARYRKVRRVLERLSPRPRAIVFSTEYQPTSRAALSAAGALAIPAVLVQHGFLGQEWLHWPIAATKLCVWGAVDRGWYLGRGHPADRLEVTGSYRAFAISDAERTAARRATGLSSRERAVTFFAPNLDLAYHRRAAAFLGEARHTLGDACRWFVRLHPSQRTSQAVREYAGFTELSSEAPLKDAYAFADLILHDYSSMAFAEYTGIQTASLALDPPYPPYYRELLGDQEEIRSIEALCRRILAIEPAYELEPMPSRSMAAAGTEALERVGGVIRELATARGPGHS